MGASLLTAGCDIQDDRIEVEVVAWGRGEESWSVLYSQIWGDPGAPGPWAELDRLLLRTFQHESGFQLSVSACCVDAGYEFAAVIEFTRSRAAPLGSSMCQS
jgi:phage terminase large subunit GpA-like protein